MTHQYVLNKIEELEKRIEALEQEPCEDAISRQALIEMAYDLSEIDMEHFTEPRMVVDVEDIQNIPPVTPAEKIGKWIFKQFDEETGISNSYWCSKCDKPFAGIYKKYCPNCGAKMVEESEKYCDRNICMLNEYNGIECDECEVTVKNGG